MFWCTTAGTVRESVVEKIYSLGAAGGAASFGVASLGLAFAFLVDTTFFFFVASLSFGSLDAAFLVVAFFSLGAEAFFSLGAAAFFLGAWKW